MEPFDLTGLKLGCATSAMQIEGGVTPSTWYAWSAQALIKDGSSCQRANDHWNRVTEDIALMKTLGLHTYRMGLEWSRIEPIEGEFDAEVIDHYRDEIAQLLAAGIQPLVTLHHLSDPLWFMEKGGFVNPDCVEIFDRYVRYCAENLGDLVTDWVTINEPNVYAAFGYFFGGWPGGSRSIRTTLRVMRHLVKCHAAAYKTLHSVRTERGYKGKTMVGIAQHMRVFEPYNKDNILDRLTARIMRFLFQGCLTGSMASGRARFPLGIAIGGGSRYFDYTGINYYTRSACRWKGFSSLTFPDKPVNDLGWELYPEGLYKLCREVYGKYKKPIWITENGICDAADDKRAGFICGHLGRISRLRAEGIPVERYYHWTLMDNFEWLEGESAPFGLYSVDFPTQRRTLRRSGELYACIIANRGLTQELIDTYLNE